MALSNWFKETQPPKDRKSSAQVGWMLTEKKAGVVFYPPERVRSSEMNKAHAKSASRCPAIIGMESRYFMVRVPFDMHLRIVKDPKGKWVLRNMAGNKSPVRPKFMGKHLSVVNEPEWRYPDRPTIQVALPYLFLTDDPIYMTQLDAFMHYRRTPLPGTIFGGRFPIDVWPRPLMWAFEWHDVEKDLILKRGDPWFYVQFETTPQDRPVTMIEAADSKELQDYMDHISAVVNYTNQSFTLFKQAEKARPQTLLKAKK